jgi:hypothetical protein
VAGGRLLPLRPRPLRPGALDSYATVPDDPRRLVPNPAKKTAAAAVTAAKNAAAKAEAARWEELTALRSPAPGTSTTITNKMLARLDTPVEAARARLEAAQAAARAVPAKIPLSQHNPRQVRLETETKLITHAIRMAACNAETILARALHGHYARAGDEACALIREALTTSGDIPPPATGPCTCGSTRSPRPAAPATSLCAQLNDTQTRYPAPRSPCATKSKNTQALHERSPYVRSPEHGLSARVTELPARGVGLELGLRCLRSSSGRSR